MPWLFVNKRKFLLLCLAGLTLFVFWGSGYFESRSAGSVSPQEILQTGIQKTLASRSYRFQTEAKMVTEGKARVNFTGKVAGEWAAPDRIRIRGSIMNTPVDFIRIGDTAYLKDHSSGRWLTIPSGQMAGAELFYAELSPAAYFKFKDISNLKYKGRHKVDGERLLLFELSPAVQNPFLELPLTDVYYKVWLSPKDYRLRRAELRARVKDVEESSVEIKLFFQDYDKSIAIEAPV
ncbi:MAG: hypothetical protein C4589_06785 [Peptococcaceae bacterium]|nr:MAG: hypothetical protein C4589_06785 [Peptococcaceae bacterium]